MASAAMLGGCTHQQSVTVPYPRWGDEVRLQTSVDAPPVALRHLSPPGDQPEACILLVHGMNEYIGRYGDIARRFAQRYAVAGFDLYAHGLSNPVIAAADENLRHGARAADVSRAYLAQKTLWNLDPMRADFARALYFQLQRCQGRPLFLLSHSLGALITASYFIRHQSDELLKQRIGGVVLLGPGFSVPSVPGWRHWLQNPLINLSFYGETHFLRSQGEPLPLLLVNQAIAIPTTLLLRSLFEVASWPGIRALTTPGTPDWVPDYLSDWDEERARHRADGYIIRRTLPRYAKAVEREIVRFRRRMAQFDLPYLLIYSGGDPITAAWGNEEFWQATRNNHPDNDVMALTEHTHHEHLFSSPPLREKVLRRIETWIARRLDSPNRH